MKLTMSEIDTIVVSSFRRAWSAAPVIGIVVAGTTRSNCQMMRMCAAIRTGNHLGRFETTM